MEFTLSLLRRIDVLGMPVKLNFKGYNLVKTVWGGILSFFLLIFLSFMMFWFGRDLFSRDSPMVRQSSVIEEDPQVAAEDFPLLVYFVDNTGSDITKHEKFKRAAKFGARLVTIEPDPEINVKLTRYNVGLSRCSTELLGSRAVEVEQFIPNVAFNWCLDKNKITVESTGEPASPDLLIKNEFATFNSSYISLYLQACDEVADPGCKEDLRSFAQVYMGIAFLDAYLDVNDYENPIKPRMSYNAHLVSTEFNFARYFSLRLNELGTDSDYFIHSIVTSPFVTKGSERLSIDLFNQENRMLYSMSLDMSQIKGITARQYPKVQEIVASIGGLTKAALFLGQALAYSFSDYTLVEGMNRHLYSGNKEKKGIRDKEQNSTIHFKQNNTSNAKTNVRISSTTSELEKIEFSYASYLVSLFSRNWAPKLAKRRDKVQKFTEILFISSKLAKISKDAD